MALEQPLLSAVLQVLVGEVDAEVVERVEPVRSKMPTKVTKLLQQKHWLMCSFRRFRRVCFGEVVSVV
jgi:hypothetical protein